MVKLRSEKGCPWDREQTRATLTKYLIEETYFGQYPKLSQDFEKSAQINPQFIPPKIIPTRGLESYFVPSNPPLPHYLKCDIILATLFPHKDWIESMIGKRQS